MVASTLSVSDGGSLYDPEQEVLAFGVLGVMDNDAGTGPAVMPFSGETKTMRKLMGGDRIMFITLGSAASSANIRVVVQFFCKS